MTKPTLAEALAVVRAAQQTAVERASEIIAGIQASLEELRSIRDDFDVHVDLEGIVHLCSAVDSDQEYAVDWNSSSC